MCAAQAVGAFGHPQTNASEQHSRAGHVLAEKTESLPFTIRLVEQRGELSKAVNIRQSAYGRHLPELAARLGEAEHLDYQPGSVVLLAESKLDGAALGTMRIQTNDYQPLALEASAKMPHWLQGKRLAEATRLAVAKGAEGRMAKIALFKAYYQYCIETGVDWMVIAGRRPLDKQYEALMFVDVFPEQGFIPMRHASNIPHRVMAFDVPAAEALWRETGHPLYDFMIRTEHPDIDLPMFDLEQSADYRQDTAAVA